MARILRKRKMFLAVSAALSVLIVTGLFIASPTRPHSRPGEVETQQKGNSTNDEPKGYSENSRTPAPSANPSTGPTSSASAPTPPSKPILQKSSGNVPGSVVPSGANMEFSCQGTPQAYCEVILTDQDNPKRLISLPKKAILSDNRGSYFAIWEWAAVSGKWSITARSSNGGIVVVSDPQTLVVR
jgi:hypothetical protein